MIKYIVNASSKKSQINKNIYGHFSEHLGRCIYEGIFVGKDSEIENIDGMRVDVVEAFKHIKVPVLRWPGGCFADEYHWKDGIGPLENRKKMINTHWGGVVEDNSFGTHEFMRLCELIGCEPYIAGNLGSGTIQEMSEWVEYMTFDGLSPMAQQREANGQKDAWPLKYFGIGNENWGCGGNMRPEYYSDEYKRYATYVRNFGGNKIFKVACGPNGDNYEWTKVLMSTAKSNMDALALHHYTLQGEWANKGSATNFNKEEYYLLMNKTMFMGELIKKHSAIMDQYDPEKKVALFVDEWGTWFDVEEGTNPGFLYQQNTMRDAMVAAVHLNLFNHHSDRVRMANIAQIVNVLQAIILTDGKEMLLTPTYHVFDLFKEHQDSTLVESYLNSALIGTDDHKVPEVMESASINDAGEVIMTLCNLDVDQPKTVDCELIGLDIKSIEGQVLTGEMTDYNTFDAPEKIHIMPLSSIKQTDKGYEVELPPCSVVKIKIRIKASKG